MNNKNRIMTIEINITEWVLYIAVIWLLLGLTDTTLALYKRYSEWRIKKLLKKGIVNKVCNSFNIDPTTSSSTICKCGCEKWEHIVN